MGVYFSETGTQECCIALILSAEFMKVLYLSAGVLLEEKFYSGTPALVGNKKSRGSEVNFGK